MSRLDIRAVIFDMDGLVLDSESGYFSAWRQAADSMGYQIDEAFCHSLSGAHGSVIAQHLLQHFGAEFDIERFYSLSNLCWRERVQQQGIPVKAGFWELLQRIHELSLPFCLATNSRRQDAEQALQWAGLSDIFSIVLTREDVKNPKPAPDLFLTASAELKLPSKNCLVLEDSPVGVAAAKAAGCPCVFVPSLQPYNEKAAFQANRVFSDLGQVADFISAEFDHSL